MTKKVLMLAAKANMIQQFNHRNIKILQDLGYEVHVATNMVDFGSMSAEENERFKQWMIDNNVIDHQVDFERRMGSLKGNIRSIRQLRQIFRENDFAFIHVHSPLGSILGRLVAKQFKVPTIYTAHGFHFFKGGPKSGWLFFYPLEWAFSFITDTLITINDEDYELAKKHMHAKKTIKNNGIGVDVIKAWDVSDEEKIIARKNIREELGIPNDAFLISSVGELSNRKNHKVVLEALKEMSSEQLQTIYYVIAGTGSNGNLLNKLADSFNFEKNFQLLGYRSDIHSINYASDVSIFPSFQEGLGVSGLDATVDGVYLIGADKRGIRDYIQPGKNGEVFSPNSPEELSRIIKGRLSRASTMSRQFDFLKRFDHANVDKVMLVVYRRYEQ
ncbi:glycosyltransferase [Leuconostoc mesenteroides]|uniref:glycosyltransferase n=1 Tax=Leuconostoc mesenteroides TaxID=1245 RepID=UPI001B8AB264|nr:glycosyltransferase [Leuconostoc mesenteroides]MBS0941485.1 glycosyltransferase [Leuconostoc mesenteroides]